MDYKIVFGRLEKTVARYTPVTYKLIEVPFSDADFRSRVKAELDAGWKLHGSPFFMPSSLTAEGYICQAVVKEVVAGGTRKVTRYGKKTSQRSGRR